MWPLFGSIGPILLTSASFSCIFFELLTGEIAFRGREPKDQIALLFRTLGTPTEVLCNPVIDSLDGSVNLLDLSTLRHSGLV